MSAMIGETDASIGVSIWSKLSCWLLTWCSSDDEAECWVICYVVSGNLNVRLP